MSLGETSSTENDAIRYLYDAKQVDVLDHVELGDGDARLLLELLSCLHVSILDAVVQHEDEDVAAPLNLPLFLLAFHNPNDVRDETLVGYGTTIPARTARRLSFCALSCINELMVATKASASTTDVGFKAQSYQLTNSPSKPRRFALAPKIVAAECAKGVAARASASDPVQRGIALVSSFCGRNE